MSPRIQTDPSIHKKYMLSIPASLHIHHRQHQKTNLYSRDIQRKTHHCLASLDLSKLYTNVPVKDTKDKIARALEENGVEPQTEQELLNWYDTITNQNKFSNNGKILIQQEGMAMGASSSGLKAELFLHNFENTHA